MVERGSVCTPNVVGYIGSCREVEVPDCLQEVLRLERRSELSILTVLIVGHAIYRFFVYMEKTRRRRKNFAFIRKGKKEPGPIGTLLGVRYARVLGTRGPGCFVENQPMTHYDPDRIKKTRLTDSVDVLGVDSHGQTHFWRSAVGGATVCIGAEGGLEVFKLAETPVDGLEGWIDYVNDQRGWNRRNYTVDWAEHAAETLAAGLEV